jgi:hypothetical protein
MMCPDYVLSAQGPDGETMQAVTASRDRRFSEDPLDGHGGGLPRPHELDDALKPRVRSAR